MAVYPTISMLFVICSLRVTGPPSRSEDLSKDKSKKLFTSHNHHITMRRSILWKTAAKMFSKKSSIQLG